MNLNSERQEPSLKGVYFFYSAVITICILALFVFNLNIYAKAVLCALILLCVLVMRSLKKAVPLPPDIDMDTVDKNEETPTDGSVSAVKDSGAIDTYLNLLIETEEELSNDPSVYKSSPSYNNLLNYRIGLKLDAMSQRNNHPNKD